MKGKSWNSLIDETEDVAREDQIFLDENLGEARMMSAKKRRALETASVSQSEKHQPTVVFSAQGTNILNNLNELVGKLEKSSNRTKTFLGDVAEAIGATDGRRRPVPL